MDECGFPLFCFSPGAGCVRPPPRRPRPCVPLLSPRDATRIGSGENVCSHTHRHSTPPSKNYSLPRPVKIHTHSRDDALARLLAVLRAADADADAADASSSPCASTGKQHKPRRPLDAIRHDHPLKTPKPLERESTLSPPLRTDEEEQDSSRLPRNGRPAPAPGAGHAARQLPRD